MPAVAATTVEAWTTLGLARHIQLSLQFPDRRHTTGLLVQALDAAQQSGLVVTDEASAVEGLGLSPRLVPGSARNFKITYPDDFALAEAVLQARSGPAT